MKHAGSKIGVAIGKLARHPLMRTAVDFGKEVVKHQAESGDARAQKMIEKAQKGKAVIDAAKKFANK